MMACDKRDDIAARLISGGPVAAKNNTHGMPVLHCVLHVRHPARNALASCERHELRLLVHVRCNAFKCKAAGVGLADAAHGSPRGLTCHKSAN